VLFKEQLRAAAIARCEALSVTPSDYAVWLSTTHSTRDMKAMADGAGVRITHLDPFGRWIDRWQLDLPGGDLPMEPIAFDADDCFRMAGPLGVELFTARGRISCGQL